MDIRRDGRGEEALDVVSNLPLEVSVFIFSLLPLPDLVQARLVSRGWDQVGCSDALWWLLYERRYKRAPGSEAGPTFMDAFRVSDLRQRAIKPGSDDQAEPRLDVFRRKSRLEARWRRGQYQTHTFKAHDFSVNGVKFFSSEHAPSPPPPPEDKGKADKKSRKRDKRKDEDEVDEVNATSSMVLLTWSDDCTVKIWQPYATTKSSASSSSTSTNPLQADCSLVLQGHRSLVFTADSDGRIVVSGGVDERMLIWQLNDGTMLGEIPEAHTKGVEKLQLHRNNVVSCGGTDATPKLWDIEAKQCVGSFKGHKGRVFTLSANFDENLLVTAGSGSTFRCWDMRTQECVLLVTNKSNKLSHNMNETLRLQGRLLFTGDSGGEVKLWDLRQLSCVGEEDFWLKPLTTYNHGSQNIYSIWNDETKIVSVGAENVLKFWQFDDYSLSEPMHEKPLHEAHIASVWTMQGDERALVCGARNGSVNILDFGHEDVLKRKKKNANCVLQ